MSHFIADFWRGLTLREGLTAAVDVLVVAFVIYRALVLVKGTRAAQMLIGLVLVGTSFFFAKLFELTTLSWLLDNLINYSIIFFIVIFQHDIRRGLMRVGQNLFGSGRQYEETFVFEEIIKAVEQMARARIGGLIVLEREADLEEFLGDPGVVLDARVTKELLVSSFVPSPDNAIHDGAVVIKNLRLHRAGCVLPLSANPKLDKVLGTRHRAAVGITEETDAVVVVVSEERGSVSLCFGGNIARDLDSASLRKALLGLFQKAKRKPAASRDVDRAVRRSAPTEPTERLVAPGTVEREMPPGDTEREGPRPEAITDEARGAERAELPCAEGERVSREATEPDEPAPVASAPPVEKASP